MHLQVRAERAPEMDIQEMQEHTVKIVQHLHHGAEHPIPNEVHDPSQSPAIQENLKKTAAKKDCDHPL
jgi:hypothetical protein